MEIHIDGPIDSGLARQVKDSLARAGGRPVVVRINSEGGSVFEGLAVFDALAGYPGQVTTVVESAALSMGSAIALAGDKVQATENAYVMAHSPHMEHDDLSESDEQLLDSMHKRLVKIYSERTGLPVEEVEELMEAERFMDSEEAMALGFVDEIVGSNSRSERHVARIAAASPAYAKAVASAKAKAATTMQSVKAEFNQAVAQAKQAGVPHGNVGTWVDRKYPGLRAKYIRAANSR